MSKPLIIGVDVRDLRVAQTGTRTYLEEICKEFKKKESNELHFHFFDTSIPVYTGGNKLFKLIEHARYHLWKQLILPLKAFFKRCDILFCTDNFVPIIHLGYKTIPVFHDAFFFESPEQYNKLWLSLYYKLAVPAAMRSPFVITTTAYAKKQIHRYTHIENEKLIYVYESGKALTDDIYTDEAATLKSIGVIQKQYLLHVGAFYKRKNIPALIYAFAKLKSTGYTYLKLVLAGPTPNNKYGNIDYLEIIDAITHTKLENDIILTGYMPDSTLGHLYKNALLYIFPSINEGFGIPILEAFSKGLPVLVANNTCLPEVGGNAVVQFDPFNTDDIAQKIKTVIDNVDLQNDMVIKGHERLKIFTWQNTAVQLIEVFKKAI
jgi:glycosyltransferase involved in cell wall biosynthesis